MLFQVAVSGFRACCCGVVRSVHAGFEAAAGVGGLTAATAGLLAAGLGATGLAGAWAKVKIGKMAKLKTAIARVRSSVMSVKKHAKTGKWTAGGTKCDVL